MEVFRTSEDDYWNARPVGAQWVTALAAGGEQQGLKTAIHSLGDPNDDETTIAAVVEYPPNYVLPRHSHDSNRLELVVSGSVEVGGKILGPGDIWTSQANQFYGPHQVGSEGCSTMELFTVAGARRLTFDAGDSGFSIDFSEPESVATAAAFLQRVE